MKINRQNMKWAARTMSIMLVVAVAEGLVGALARKPFPWVAIIPGFLPLLICVFVVIPMTKENKSAAVR